MVRARSLIGEVHQHHIVHQLPADLPAERGGIDLDGPLRGAGAVHDRDGDLVRHVDQERRDRGTRFARSPDSGAVSIVLLLGHWRTTPAASAGLPGDAASWSPRKREPAARRGRL